MTCRFLNLRGFTYSVTNTFSFYKMADKHLKTDSALLTSVPVCARQYVGNLGHQQDSTESDQSSEGNASHVDLDRLHDVAAIPVPGVPVGSRYRDPEAVLFGTLGFQPGGVLRGRKIVLVVPVVARLEPSAGSGEWDFGEF